MIPSDSGLAKRSQGKRVGLTAAGRSNADWWGAAAFVVVMLVIGLLVDDWLCAGVSYAAASALAVGVLAMVTHRRGIGKNRRRWLLIGGMVVVVLVCLGISTFLLPGTVARWVLGVDLPPDVQVVHAERWGQRDPAGIVALALTRDRFGELVDRIGLQRYTKAERYRSPDSPDGELLYRRDLAVVPEFEPLIPWDHRLEAYRRDFSREGTTAALIIALWDEASGQAYVIRAEF